MINTKQGINLENILLLLLLCTVGKNNYNSKYKTVVDNKDITKCINADKIAKTCLGMIKQLV